MHAKHENLPEIFLNSLKTRDEGFPSSITPVLITSQKPTNPQILSVSKKRIHSIHRMQGPKK